MVFDILCYNSSYSWVVAYLFDPLVYDLGFLCADFMEGACPCFDYSVRFEAFWFPVALVDSSCDSVERVCLFVLPSVSGAVFSVG